MIGRQASKSGLTSDCKLHFVGLLDYFRGLQNFEANHATIVGEIGNHPGTNLVTFLYARIPQRNGERVRFFVVFSFHTTHENAAWPFPRHNGIWSADGLLHFLFFETRSLPSSLAATHRGFAFYVAFPKAPFDLAARRFLPRVS